MGLLGSLWYLNIKSNFAFRLQIQAEGLSQYKAGLKYLAMGGVAGLLLPGRSVLAPAESGPNPQNEQPGLCSKPPCFA